jgi:hypothetical protein
MRIEIGTHRHLDWSDFLFAPGDVTGDRIYADVQNLGIERRELFFSGIEFGYLRRSSRSPVERMKRYNQILASKIVARAHCNPQFAGNSREREIGCGIANLQRHFLSLQFFEQIVLEIVRAKAALIARN